MWRRTRTTSKLVRLFPPQPLDGTRVALWTHQQRTRGYVATCCAPSTRAERVHVCSRAQRGAYFPERRTSESCLPVVTRGGQLTCRERPLCGLSV